MVFTNRTTGRLDQTTRELYKVISSTSSTDYNNPRLIAHVSPYQMAGGNANNTSTEAEEPSTIPSNSTVPLRQNNNTFLSLKIDAKVRKEKSKIGEDDRTGESAHNSETEGDASDWTTDLQNIEKRDLAILELCKNSDVIDNIGNLLWSSNGTMAILLGELVKLYPLINPPSLPGSTIAKVCSITALLQRIVLEPDTRKNFLNSKIIMYLLPFLAVEGNTREVEHLRVCILSLLCTMARLLSVSELEEFLELRQSEVFPLTIQTLKECISEVGRTMATILLSLLLRDPFVVELISNRRAVFIDIVMALNSSLNYIAKRAHAPARAKRLLNFIIICLQQMALHARLREALAHSLPAPLRDNRLIITFQGDADVYQWLFRLKDTLLMGPMTPENSDPRITVSAARSSRASDFYSSGAYSKLAVGEPLTGSFTETGRLSNMWKA